MVGRRSRLVQNSPNFSIDISATKETKSASLQKYKYVLLMHPTSVIQRLKNEGKIAEDWWNTYQARKTITKELTFDQRSTQKLKASSASKTKVASNKSKTKPN
jgi:hypothetical protein